MTETNEYLYEVRDCLLTKTELAYLGAIAKCLPNGFYMQPQVNLASIIRKTDNSKFQNELFRNVDACIFDAGYRPIAVIEINDATHNDPKRRERDIKVRNILEEAGLPIITLWTSKGINQDYITKKIYGAIETRKNPVRIKHSGSKTADATDTQINAEAHAVQPVQAEQPLNESPQGKPLNDSTRYSHKNQTVSVILSVFWGFIGVPFYYIKRPLIGIVFSLIFVFFSIAQTAEFQEWFPITAEIPFSSIFIFYGLLVNISTAILFGTGKMKDQNGYIIKNKKK